MGRAGRSARPARGRAGGCTRSCLRFSEINGLQVGDIDLKKRRISVVRAWTQDETGVWHLGEPKYGKRRTVPVPAFLVLVLEAQMEEKADGARLIKRRNGSDKPLPYPGKANGWGEASWLERGLEDANIARLTVHDLRHTAASLAVQVGANVKALSRMLGHADASMTLNVYADLFDSDLDDVAARLDDAFGRA
ncbi:site-specific integrase [Brevibacterium moorei]|uniref:site-specific integrase n=1 Tax=Brevibacterium moorei TaxID=2968457 RepID=UPI00211BF2CE|nr:site-specific integrase [Brevibacterium sp. 68QC2CO]